MTPPGHQPWPDDLPTELVQQLERLVAKTPDAPGPTDKIRNKEARRIANETRALLKRVRQFYRDYPQAIDEGARDRACEAAQPLEMDASETRLFMAGQSHYELQHVLNGLSLHMDSIATPGKSGPREGHLQLYVVEMVGHYFGRAELPMTDYCDGLFSRTLEAAFDRMNWGPPDHYRSKYISTKQSTR